VTVREPTLHSAGQIGSGWKRLNAAFVLNFDKVFMGEEPLRLRFCFNYF
jgi:hypothetical protein